MYSLSSYKQRERRECGDSRRFYRLNVYATNLYPPTGALDSRNSKVLMDRLSALNEDEGRTIVMVTHDANAASYCSRILFIQDGRLFHELRRNVRTETTERFYERIVTVLSQLGGGSANVL